MTDKVKLRECPFFKANRCAGEEYCGGCEDLHEVFNKIDKLKEYAQHKPNCDLNFMIMPPIPAKRGICTCKLEELL